MTKEELQKKLSDLNEFEEQVVIDLEGYFPAMVSLSTLDRERKMEIKKLFMTLVNDSKCHARKLAALTEALENGARH